LHLVGFFYELYYDARIHERQGEILWLPTIMCHLQIPKMRTIKTTYIYGSDSTEWSS